METAVQHDFIRDGIPPPPTPPAVAAAMERRDEGMMRASASSGGHWQAYAIEFLRRYLTTHKTMFVDDLWDAGMVAPTSPRALGAVIQHAVTHAWVAEIRTDDGLVAAKPSVRSNMQLKRVWESRLWVPA